MKKTLTAVPAYNRTYNSESDCLTDWCAGKDFQVFGGPYFSIRDVDILKHKYSEINFYYKYPKSDMFAANVKF